MASTVTYDGPKDPTLVDSVAYQIDTKPGEDGEDITFRKGVPVEGVTEAIVKRLQQDEAHNFTVDSGAKTTGGAS